MSRDLFVRRHRTAPPAPQGGAVMVLITVALLAIVAMAGLALDSSHLLLNKARLQNAVDAAALAAAKELDQSGNINRATNTANSLLRLNAAAAGNRELNAVLSSGLSVTVEYSSTLQPFSPGTTPSRYVRVRARNFRMPAFLLQVVGVNVKTAGASAVAGPSPTILQACNLVPLIACGTPGVPYWGFAPGQPKVLKGASGDGVTISAGNYQLARLGGSGADTVRQALAGGYEGCSQTAVATQPGVTAGPTQQGINTRFNQYQGGGIDSTRYPPDVIWKTTHQTNLSLNALGQITQGGAVVTSSSQLAFNYATYAALQRSDALDTPPPTAAFDRRVLTTMIADCSGAKSGQTTLPVLGLGCFFLLQQALTQGGESRIYGEFVSDCTASGIPGPNPNSVDGPYRIQLYRDFQSQDS